MNCKIVTLPEQTVAGIKARTNNASPDMKNVIRSLWERFYQSGVNTPVSPKKTALFSESIPITLGMKKGLPLHRPEKYIIQ